MSNRTAQVKALLLDLQQDNVHYQQLATLLQQQRAALLRCHALQSATLGEQLMTLYQQLNSSARRRAATLSELAFSADGQGMSALFSRLPVPIQDKARHWWIQLQQQALSCQQLNQRNGLLLGSQHETLTTLLNQPDDFLYSR